MCFKVPILNKEKLRLKEVECPAQSHIESQDEAQEDKTKVPDVHSLP